MRSLVMSKPLMLPQIKPISSVTRTMRMTGSLAIAMLALGFASNRSQTLELGMINYLWPSLTIVLATVFGLQRFHAGLVPGVLLAMAGIGFSVAMEVAQHV